MFLKLIYIALGSGLGGVCRYLLSKSINPGLFSVFPWGTFVVNVLGCLLIGVIYGLIDRGVTLSENMRLLLTVGFCGGFTTFSTFVNENYVLFGSSESIVMILYASLSFLAGFTMIYLGHYLTSL